MIDVVFLNVMSLTSSSRFEKREPVSTVKMQNNVHVVGQNEILVKMILTWFDSQFPLSSNPNYS